MRNDSNINSDNDMQFIYFQNTYEYWLNIYLILNLKCDIDVIVWFLQTV